MGNLSIKSGANSGVISNEEGFFTIHSKNDESYFDQEKEEHIEKTKNFSWKWKENQFVKME